MKKYVVDASFIAKSILEEDESVLLRFRNIFKLVSKNKIKITAPFFLITEVANAIRYSTKDEKEAVLTFEDFLLLPIELTEVSLFSYKKIIELSYLQNTTVYDTSYHVLALEQNAIFLTCDGEYYKKAKELGNIELIK